MLRYEGTPMVRRTRERAKWLNHILLLASILIFLVAWGIVLTLRVVAEPEPPAPPTTPAYVADLEQRLDVIEAKLDGVMFRLEQVESISGETYDMLSDFLDDL